MQEQELFETYELKGWQLSTRLYQIIGVSVIINLVVFVLMAQANFLTGKTCDSPIASGVCSVLDTLYVGGMILDADASYVDKPFEVTEIGDGDEITYINVGDYKPLTYPEGYFALANPDQLNALNDPTLASSEISTTPSDGGLMNTTPVLPPDNGDVLDSPLPDNPLGNATQGKVKKPNSRNNSLLNINPTDQDEQTFDITKVKPVEVNKQVMIKFGNSVKEKVDKNEVDLNQQFKVVIEGALTADGKFDTSIDKKTKKEKTTFTDWEGDEKMVNVVKEALQAVGDSGWLGYLKIFGAEKVKITFIQDQDNFLAFVESEQKTPEKARTMASGMNFYILGAKAGIKGEDEQILFSGIQPPTSEGKIFKLNLVLPRPVVQEMIKRQIKKAAEAEKSTAQTENSNEKVSER